MSVSPAALHEIATSVCVVLFGWHLTPVGDMESACPADATGAWVGFEGAWRGWAGVVLNRRLATDAARTMFGRDDGFTPEDIDAAVSEFANQIGGGVKGLLPSTSRMSLPRSWSGVWPGPDPCVALRSYVLDGHPLRVLLVPATDVPEPRPAAAAPHHHHAPVT